MLLRLKTHSYIFMASDGKHMKGKIKKPSADFVLIMMSVRKCVRVPVIRCEHLSVRMLGPSLEQ